MFVKRKIDPEAAKKAFSIKRMSFSLFIVNIKTFFELSIVTMILLFTIETYCTQQNIIWALQFHDCFPADVMRKQAD